jgi:hypothetical protein
MPDVLLTLRTTRHRCLCACRRLSHDGPSDIAARFRASPAGDEVATEAAAAMMRAGEAAAAADGVALMQKLLAPFPENMVHAARGPASAAQMGSWAAFALDSLMHEADSMMEALEAQQQRFHSALLQQQAHAQALAAFGPGPGHARPPPPRRPCPHRAAMLAAAEARRREASENAAALDELLQRPDGPNMVAVIGGHAVQLVDLSAAAASFEDVDEMDYLQEGAEVEGGAALRDLEGQEPEGSGRLLVLVLSAACAATFVAFVRSLVQLRATLSARGGDGGGSDEAYAKLAGDGDACGGGSLKAYRGGTSRRASRRSTASGDELEHPLLVDQADVGSARVLVVVNETAEQPAAATAAQAYANECYQPLPGKEQ